MGLAAPGSPEAAGPAGNEAPGTGLSAKSGVDPPEPASATYRVPSGPIVRPRGFSSPLATTVQFGGRPAPADAPGLSAAGDVDALGAVEGASIEAAGDSTLPDADASADGLAAPGDIDVSADGDASPGDSDADGLCACTPLAS